MSQTNKIESEKIILLINTGTPENTEIKTVKNYLREFLMDKYVVSIPFPIRFLLVNGIIAPFRAPHSAKKYATIFKNGVSPLLTHTQKLKETLSKTTNTPVEIGMRYGKPTTDKTVSNILKTYQNLKEVILVPLFPHKTQSSFISAVEHFKYNFKRYNSDIAISVIPPYFQHKLYIQALQKHISSHLKQKPEKLIFSFHGIPLSHESKFHNNISLFDKNMKCGCESKKTEEETCYYYQCLQTAKKTAQLLNLKQEEWEITFQSRMGFTKWHQPYTIERLKELPKQENIKSIAIVTPSFITDCLETLEEVDIEYREIFMQSGGKKFQYIPTLNNNKYWVESLNKIIEEKLL